MKNSEKHSLNDSPKWVEQISNKEIVSLAKDDEHTKEIIESGKGVCYFYREQNNTSNTKNELYYFRVWKLSNSDLLQGASIFELFVNHSQRAVIHRVLVIRDGKIIDKKDSLNIRVLDDEQTSGSGSINKAKKINFSVTDLRLDDIIAEEYSLVTEFGKESFLDKLYFRYTTTLPNAYWYYCDYKLSTLNNRRESLKVSQKYFRDSEGKIITKDTAVVSPGNEFHFHEKKFRTTYKENLLFEEIEVATDASWKDISSSVFVLYRTEFDSESLKKHEVFKTLKLGDKEVSLAEKIQSIIEYTQNRIVYLYDQEVMHGHVPQSSVATLELKSGDCKAKSLLLVDLLETIGVKSEILLVNYNYDYFLGSQLPSPFIFNHAIVRIFYQDKTYLVDATWTDRYGELPFRSQPHVNYFFPINGSDEAMLEHEEVKEVLGINIEENVLLELKGDEGTIVAEGAYQRESADIARNNFRKLAESQNVLNKNNAMLARFSFAKERLVGDLFSDVEFKIVSDDKKQNKVNILYKAKLIKPYEKSGNLNVIKQYFSIDYDTLKNYKHKEVPAYNFCSFPIKCVVTIRSDMFVGDNDPVTKRNTLIDNSHFKFSNSKKLSIKSVEVTGVYMPKKYGYIDKNEMEEILKDYKKLNESNFGVGVVYLTMAQYAQRKWYFGLIMFIMIRAILEFFGH